MSETQQVEVPTLPDGYTRVEHRLAKEGEWCLVWRYGVNKHHWVIADANTGVAYLVACKPKLSGWDWFKRLDVGTMFRYRRMLYIVERGPGTGQQVLCSVQIGFHYCEGGLDCHPGLIDGMSTDTCEILYPKVTP